MINMSLVSAVSSIKDNGIEHIIYAEFAKRDSAGHNIINTYATKTELNNVTSGSLEALSSISGILDDKILNEELRARQQEYNIAADLSAKYQYITTEENKLNNLLTAEINRAEEYEAYLNSSISGEIERSVAREDYILSSLSSLISAESARAIDYELYLNSAISSEIDNEVSARQSADTILQENINAETIARQNADNNLQSQIDTIEATQNVIDLVSNYAALQNYDTSAVKLHDKIQVINDETSGNQSTIYSWENSAWSGIGLFGPYYTQAQVDNLYNELANTKQDNLSAGDGIAITENIISHSVKIIESDNYDTVEGTKLTVYLKNNKYKKITFNKTITDIEFIIEKSENNILQEAGFEFTCPEDSELENVTFSVLNDNTIKILTIIPDSYTSPNVYQGTIVNYKCTIGEFEVED